MNRLIQLLALIAGIYSLGATALPLPGDRSNTTAMRQNEILRRQKVALEAIRNEFGKKEDKYGVNLFVLHHLKEIDGIYWQKHLGTSHPEPLRVLDILVFRTHWGNEDPDGIDTFDFTLPDHVTDYVIAVHFNKSGQVQSITMES